MNKITPELMDIIRAHNALREEAHNLLCYASDLLLEEVKDKIYVDDSELDVAFLQELLDVLDGSFVEFEISRRLRMYKKNKGLL